MTIELTPKQEEFVQRQVALGGYRSADEVLAVALRTLEERGESLAPVSDIRAKVLRGIAQLDQGEFSSKSFEDIALFPSREALRDLQVERWCLGDRSGNSWK